MCPEVPNVVMHHKAVLEALEVGAVMLAVAIDEKRFVEDHRHLATMEEW